MYDEMHKWLILGRTLNETVALLKDDAFDISTDVTIAVPSLTGYQFYDVYNPCKERGGSLNVTALGYWTEKSGVAIKLSHSKFEGRSNLHGMKIKLGILVSVRGSILNSLYIYKKKNDSRWRKFEKKESLNKD